MSTLITIGFIYTNSGPELIIGIGPAMMDYIPNITIPSVTDLMSGIRIPYNSHGHIDLPQFKSGFEFRLNRMFDLPRVSTVNGSVLSSFTHGSNISLKTHDFNCLTHLMLTYKAVSLGLLMTTLYAVTSLIDVIIVQLVPVSDKLSNVLSALNTKLSINTKTLSGTLFNEKLLFGPTMNVVPTWMRTVCVFFAQAPHTCMHNWVEKASETPIVEWTCLMHCGAANLRYIWQCAICGMRACNTCKSGKRMTRGFGDTNNWGNPPPGNGNGMAV